MLMLGNRFDKRAIMRDAHRVYRSMGPLGWSWSRCLSYAWVKAREVRRRAMGETRPQNWGVLAALRERPAARAEAFAAI